MATSTAAATQAVMTTRMAALMDGARLNFDDGCLRAGDTVLVWPPEFDITMEADQVTVTDGFTGETVTWQLGEALRLGGGDIPLSRINAQAGRWYGTCDNQTGGYWLVGDIAVPTRAASAVPIPPL